ncbi:hypothetical protein [Bacillus atrophaeus]|uniref:hypothetical protein n=1 Tax=Bacillus atrophaeus TaxID=1452 RepID=UPI0022802062|nr:hypothetical protein [Bacillus atrophaeus]MCY8856439.1 hypothetical protein [Bacillus atrophaeus]
MRKIKFRGMGINGEWYYGNLSIIKQRIKSMGIDPGSYISNKAGETGNSWAIHRIKGQER